MMEERVPAENLYWDGNDINEWGYDDKSDYLYKDTRNNRKLNDLVTRDDKGNIIPLSQRFNARRATLASALSASREQQGLMQQKKQLPVLTT